MTEHASGSLRVMDDVVIEHRSDDTITLLTTESVATGRSMVLVFDEDDGKSRAVIVHAVTCTPAAVDGLLRHRVRLRCAGPWTSSV